MSEYALRLAKPHCEACHKPKNNDIDNHKEHQRIHQQFIDSSKELQFPKTPEDVIGPKLLKENLTLAERLQQTLHKNKQPEQKEEEL